MQLAVTQHGWRQSFPAILLCSNGLQIAFIKLMQPYGNGVGPECTTYKQLAAADPAACHMQFEPINRTCIASGGAQALRLRQHVTAAAQAAMWGVLCCAALCVCLVAIPLRIAAGQKAHFYAAQVPAQGGQS